jgi:hypothetical protein
VLCYVLLNKLSREFGGKLYSLHAAQQLIQPDRPQLAFHARLLVQFELSLASGGVLIRALGPSCEVTNDI